MYCPGCGAQNAEQTKYCRACGNDLKVISQTMKGHLPVILASKIDAILDRKNERFRRDSLLVLLFGVGCLLKSIFGLLGGKSLWGSPGFFVALAGLMFMLSLWEYLAYRRSLSPDAQWALAQTAADEAVSSSVLTLNLSQPDAVETVSAPTTDKLAPHGSAGTTGATTRQLDASVKGQEEKF